MPKSPEFGPSEEEPEKSYAQKMIREMKEKLEKENRIYKGYAGELQRIQEKNLKGETLTAEERELLEKSTTSSTVRKFKRKQGEK